MSACILVLPRVRGWGQKRRPLRGSPAPPFRASRPQAFKISNTDTAAAYGVAKNAIVTGRPVPSGRDAVNPSATGPAWQRLAEAVPPTLGPACHRLRMVGGGVDGGRAMGPTKEGGAREHHTATPHLPSIRLHTPLAFLERETPAAPGEVERETKAKEHRPPVRPQQEREIERERERERRLWEGKKRRWERSATWRGRRR